VSFFSSPPGELCGFGGFLPFFFGALACCLGAADIFYQKKVVQGTAPEITEPTQCSSEMGYFGVFFIQAHFWFVVLSRPPLVRGRGQKIALLRRQIACRGA